MRRALTHAKKSLCWESFQHPKSSKFKPKLAEVLQHHEFQMLCSQRHDKSQGKVATRTTSLLAILTNCNGITERQAKEASLSVCFDIEEPGSQVQRRVVPCLEGHIPVSTTQYPSVMAFCQASLTMRQPGLGSELRN